MKKIIKQLLLFYFIFVLAKAIISFFVVSPTMFGDEYNYAKMAQSILEYGRIFVNGEPFNHHSILYSILLSPAYLAKNMALVYPIMKIINAFISSLIIFPAFLITKEFLGSRRSLLVAVLVSIMPSNFAIAPYILSENLFYPLFLFAIYFIYRSFKEVNYRWDILAGLFIGLCYLTKTIGIVLIPATFLIFLKDFITKKDTKILKKKLLLFFIAFLTVLPWLIRNGLQFGFTLGGILGYSNELNAIATQFSFISFFYWIILFLGVIILSSGVIFPMLSILIYSKLKDKTIFWLLILSGLFLVIFASINSAGYSPTGRWLVGRPIGRYVDAILPLIIILGLYGFKQIRELSIKGTVILFSLFLVLCSPLNWFKLLPVNNISLSYLGFINHALDYIKFNKFIIMVPLFFLLPFSLVVVKNFSFKKLISLFLILFLGVSLLAVGMNGYNAKYNWNDLEQMKLGRSFDKEGIVIFDEKDQSETLPYGQPTLRAAFWMENEIRVGTRFDKGDYFVSTQSLNLPIIAEFGIIKVYDL